MIPDIAAAVVYVVGFVVCYRKVYVPICEAEPPDDNVERVLMAVVSMAVSAAWPVVLIGYFVWQWVTPKTIHQKQQELAEREKRIAELERDTGIGKGDR